MTTNPALDLLDEVLALLHRDPQGAPAYAGNGRFRVHVSYEGLADLQRRASRLRAEHVAAALQVVAPSTPDPTDRAARAYLELADVALVLDEDGVTEWDPDEDLADRVSRRLAHSAAEAGGLRIALEQAWKSNRDREAELASLRAPTEPALTTDSVETWLLCIEEHVDGDSGPLFVMHENDDGSRAVFTARQLAEQIAGPVAAPAETPSQVSAAADSVGHRLAAPAETEAGEERGSRTVRVTATPAAVLRHAAEFAARSKGDDRFEAQARQLYEWGYRIVGDEEDVSDGAPVHDVLIAARALIALHDDPMLCNTGGPRTAAAIDAIRQALAATSPAPEGEADRWDAARRALVDARNRMVQPSPNANALNVALKVLDWARPPAPAGTPAEGVGGTRDAGLADAVGALATTISGSPSTTAALLLRYPGLAHAIDRVTRFADPPVDVYAYRPAKPCGRCGHDVSEHHKLHCEADDGDCQCPGGWTPVAGAGS